MPSASPVTASSLHKSSARYVTEADGAHSTYSFSFGPHYESSNTHFGVLLANNEERLDPGAGFAKHAHRNTEIVTWVLEGSLRHRDSAGNTGLIHPGQVQYLSAGYGTEHSEVNDSTADPARFIQMWFYPQQLGAEPKYECRDVNDQLEAGRLVPIASGRAEHAGWAAIQFRQSGAAVSAARLRAGQTIELAPAPYLHVFVTRGLISIGSNQLAEGDAVRVANAVEIELRAETDGEVLVCHMYSSLTE